MADGVLDRVYCGCFDAVNCITGSFFELYDESLANAVDLVLNLPGRDVCDTAVQILGAPFCGDFEFCLPSV